MTLESLPCLCTTGNTGHNKKSDYGQTEVEGSTNRDTCCANWTCDCFGSFFCPNWMDLNYSNSILVCVNSDIDTLYTALDFKKKKLSF